MNQGSWDVAPTPKETGKGVVEEEKRGTWDNPDETETTGIVKQTSTQVTIEIMTEGEDTTNPPEAATQDRLTPR